MKELEPDKIAFLSTEDAAKRCNKSVEEFKQLHDTEGFFKEATTSPNLFTVESINGYLGGEPSPAQVAQKKQDFADAFNQKKIDDRQRGEEKRILEEAIAEAFKAKVRYKELKQAVR